MRDEACLESAPLTKALSTLRVAVGSKELDLNPISFRCRQRKRVSAGSRVAVNLMITGLAGGGVSVAARGVAWLLHRCLLCFATDPYKTTRRGYSAVRPYVPPCGGPKFNRARWGAACVGRSPTDRRSRLACAAAPRRVSFSRDEPLGLHRERASSYARSYSLRDDVALHREGAAARASCKDQP